MRHDLPLIAVILGTLQAGRIVLCLDRSQPAIRLSQMLADAQPTLIVSDDLDADLALVGAFGPALVDAEAIAGEEAGGDLTPWPEPLDEALLFYTAGSSGHPRGVVQNHRGVVHGSVTHAKALAVSPADRLALLHSCSSAASRSMLFGGLLSGATICPFDVRHQGTAALIDWLRREQITVCHMVPSLFRHVAASLNSASPLPALRVIRLGGEGTTMADVELYRRHFPATCVLINGFGATEIGMTACAFRIDHDTVLSGPLVPVGYALPGVDLRLLHEDGRAAASGEIGEIVMRSRYLASGYWRDAASTRSAFAPLAAGDSTPAYHTGDLGRVDATGCLTHLGRCDQQVKIRGHRCELVEIEAALQQVDGVTAAAVATRPGPAADLQLVAFLVTAAPGLPSGDTVLKELTRSLPRPMIPSVAIALAALPVLPGGKLDRQALTKMAAESLDRERLAPSPVPPGDLLQLQLKGIWERALLPGRVGVNGIGVDDDFFALGGDSLAAASICSMIDRAFGIRLPLLALAERPTISQLAGLIRERDEKTTSWSPLVALQPRGAQPPLYCVPGAGFRRLRPAGPGPAPGAGPAALRPPGPRPRRPRALPSHDCRGGSLLPRRDQAASDRWPLLPRRSVAGRHHCVRDGASARSGRRGGRPGVAARFARAGLPRDCRGPAAFPDAGCSASARCCRDTWRTWWSRRTCSAR